MKKILIIVVLVVITAGWYWLRMEKPTEIVLDKADWHPYAIEKMMTKAEINGTITVEKELTEQPKFKSYIVSFLSENLKQYSLMHIPKGVAPEKGWPVIVVNHGYINPKEYSVVDSYKNTSAYYANSGFLVLKPDYRGHDDSEGTPTQLIARNQYAIDVLNLVKAVKSIPEANTDLIFLYGHSLGGDVALQVAEVSEKIKGVSLWAPAITYYPLSLTYFGKSHNANANYNVMAAEELSAKYGSQLSALDNINMIKVPVIIQHGTTDESVPFEWGKQLNDALVKNGKQSILYSYAKDNHNISGHWAEALNRDIEFFRKLTLGLK